MTEASFLRDDDGAGQDPIRCTLMDGSDLYGAARPDGWLETMKRHVCTFTDGSFLLLDLLQTKSDRRPLKLYGSQYGGPDFDEGTTASQRLTLDEYFYTDTSAEIEVLDGRAREVLPYDRGTTKRCHHVDVDVDVDVSQVEGTAIVHLRPACGIGSYRDTDGNGIIAGISVGGQGSFVYDGLVTSVNRWFTPHALRKRRFRFVSDSTVGPEGDVRAFVLMPTPAAAAAVRGAPVAHLANCAVRLGCGCVEGGAEAPIVCSCVQACVGGTVSWVVVLEGALRLVRRVGTCGGGNGSSSVVLDGEIVADVRTQLGLETLAPTGDVTAVDPSEVPTRYPSKVPTLPPTPVLTDMDPTPVPTANPTNKPTISPTKEPTANPTKEPTANPTKEPTANP